MRVCYARDVWRTNGLRIRIRLVVLSNFHVQSIFIRVTDYFILIFKVLNHFLNYYYKINSKLALLHQHDVSMTSAVNRGVEWSNWRGGSRMSLTD